MFDLLVTIRVSIARENELSVAAGFFQRE